MMNSAEKKIRIMDLLFEIDDTVFKQFFDIESDEMLDKKIDVLEKLASGLVPADIPDYYEVLELYPKDGEMWDWLIMHKFTGLFLWIMPIDKK